MDVLFDPSCWKGCSNATVTDLTIKLMSLEPPMLCKGSSTKLLVVGIAFHVDYS